MSSSVESRILTMKFDNRDFQKGIDSTLHSLGVLGKALDAGFTSKAMGGLSSLTNKVRGFSLDPLGNQVQGVSGKFLAMGTVAVTALSRITNAAITAGIDFAKQFTGLQAAQQGFQEYETKLGSIQTILANTGRDLNNQKDLNEVTRALDQLNTYSDKTIYNFGEMARNIGTFTAAGVDLETSVNSIKGIANIAALSGSNAQQASTAMYQLSQAIAAGKVGLQDWNSVVNAGMGGKVFQTALTRTATAMGVLDESAVKLNKETGQLTVNGVSFRESISAIGEEKWLTGNVLTNTLAQFSGDLTDAQLKAQGFTQQQIKEIRDLSETAVDAATKVKTVTQLVGTIQEALASGWAKTWEIIIGDFGEAKELFTSINDVVGGFIQRQAEARNKMLQDWKDEGGREDLLAGFANLFTVFKRIIKPIRNAFRDIFPPATGKQLAAITEAFRKFTEGLIYSRGTMRDIREIFRAIFTVFRVGFGIIGALIKYIAEFFGIIVTGGGGDALGAIVHLVAQLAKGVTWLGKWLEEGAKMEKFFDAIIDARNAVLEPLVGTIGAVVEALVALVTGDVSGFFEKLEESGSHFMDFLGVIGEKIQTVATYIGSFFSELSSGGFDAVISIFEKVGGAVDTLMEKLSFGGGQAASGVSGAAGGIAEGVGEQVDKLQWIADAARKVWDVITATFSGIAGVIGPVGGFVGEALGHIADAFLDFLDNATLDDLVKIINTGVFVMLYNSIRKLANTTGGLLGFGDAATDSFNQLTGTLSSMQNAVRAQMILAIAGAVGILAASLIGISLIPKDKLQGALVAISALLGQVLILMVGMGKLTFSGGVWAMGPAMIGIATALLIMAGALRAFEDVDTGSIVKMAIALGIMVVPLKLIGSMPHLAAAGAGMIGLSAAVAVLAGALLIFEKVDGDSIWKLVGVMTTMTVALAALGAVGPAVLAGGGALLLAAPALIGIGIALKVLEKVDGDAIKKLVAIVATLAIGLTLMIAALPGAVALMTVALALTALMPVLVTLGEMDFGEFAKSLGFLIVTLVTLGAIGATFGAMSPLIAAFGIALMTVGIAMVLVGGGAALLALGLAGIAASGTAAMAVLAGGITTFLVLLPQWIIQFGQSIGAIIDLIRQHGPDFVEAMAGVMRKLIQKVGDMAPDLGRTLERLIEAGLRVVRNTSDDWIETGLKLITDFLDALGKKGDDLAEKGADAVIAFLKGIQRKDDEIAEEGRKTINSLIQALGRAVVNQIGQLLSIGSSIASSVINGIAAGVRSMWGAVQGAFSDLYDNLPGWAKETLDILTGSPSRVFMKIGESIPLGTAQGITDSGYLVEGAAQTLGDRAVGAMASAMATLGDLSAETMEFDPTIAPVLDLSQVRAEAGKLGSILNPDSLQIGTTLSEAQTLAEEIAAANSQNGGDSESGSGGDTFNQYINSPKAVSPVEVYRGTKSLLALKERKLGGNREAD